MAKSGILTPAHDLVPDDDDTPKAKAPKGGPGTRTIKLGDAGTLTFHVSDLNVLQLSPDERTLLFNIVDQLDAFERVHSTPTPPPQP